MDCLLSFNRILSNSGSIIFFICYPRFEIHEPVSTYLNNDLYYSIFFFKSKYYTQHFRNSLSQIQSIKLSISFSELQKMKGRRNLYFEMSSKMWIICQCWSLSNSPHSPRALLLTDKITWHRRLHRRLFFPRRKQASLNNQEQNSQV